MSLNPRVESALFIATLEASLIEARARNGRNAEALDERLTRLENICVATIKMVNAIADSLHETHEVLRRTLERTNP